jgi:hypothetical protein
MLLACYYMVRDVNSRIFGVYVCITAGSMICVDDVSVSERVKRVCVPPVSYNKPHVRYFTRCILLPASGLGSAMLQLMLGRTFC